MVWPVIGAPNIDRGSALPVHRYRPHHRARLRRAGYRPSRGRRVDRGGASNLARDRDVGTAQATGRGSLHAFRPSGAICGADSPSCPCRLIRPGRAVSGPASQERGCSPRRMTALQFGIATAAVPNSRNSHQLRNPGFYWLPERIADYGDRAVPTFIAVRRPGTLCIGSGVQTTGDGSKLFRPQQLLVRYLLGE
jgi:hypothetical protein